MTEISPEDLKAEDGDTAPEQLHYLTTQPSNGHLAVKSAPTRPVMSFTQAHVDQGQLLFVHSGKIIHITQLSIHLLRTERKRKRPAGYILYLTVILKA